MAQGKFFGSKITGGVIGSIHFKFLEDDTNSTRPITLRGAVLAHQSGSTSIYTTNASTQLWRPIQDAHSVFLDESTNQVMRQRFWSATIPSTMGGAYINAALSIAGGPTDYTTVTYGTIEMYLRRLDTGVVDYGKYLVQLNNDQAANTTLAAAAALGSSSITLTSSSGWSIGATIILNGSDSYVLSNYSGSNVWTLATPLRGNYTSATPATSVNTMSTITAPTNTWINIRINSNQVLLTNTITGAPPIQCGLTFNYLQSSAPV